MAKYSDTEPGPKSGTVQNVLKTANFEPFQNIELPAWLSGFGIQAIIVALLALAFYANTIQNEFAMDDYAVIIQNEPVYRGLAGLKDIFTRDTYDSYYRQTHNTNQLYGGRYRPLSVATFALEQEFFGTVAKDQVDSVMKHNNWAELYVKHDPKFMSNMHVRHLWNVIWFALSVLVLLYFLRTVVFKSNPLLAFLTAIIFTIHPIHTEVVANLKSRDEVLSLLFICLTFVAAFKYQEQKERRWWLYLGLVSYFLAFLSKEYAVGLMVLLPLAFFLFNQYSFSKSVVASLPYAGVVLVYAVLRMQVVAPLDADAESGVSILADPYAFASATEKMATLIATPLNYLRLLVFPHPLSADYSYNSIPYKDFASLVVWLSLVVHAALFGAFFYYLKRKSVLSFAAAFYLVNLLLVCNIFFNIGGTMGERLIYHSSVGFSIALAYVILVGTERLVSVTASKAALVGVMVVLVVLCGVKTTERNAEWKNDVTLFAHDIKVVPNSAVANASVGLHLIVKSDIEKNETARKDDLNNAVGFLNRAIKLDSNNPLSYFNKGLAFVKLAEPDSIVMVVKEINDFYPHYPGMMQLYYEAGKLYSSKKQFSNAKIVYQCILQNQPKNSEVQRELAKVNDSLKRGE